MAVKTLHELPHQSAQYLVEYPSVNSEFEVHATLFMELKACGYDVRGEVKARGCFGLRAAKTGCRFDLVIFKDQVAVLILEVKGNDVKHKAGVEGTRQGQRYPCFGIPVWMVYGMPGAQEAIKRAKEFLG